MSHRFRSISAILSLLALSAYYAEGVWAGTCSPDMNAAVAHAGSDDGSSHALMSMHGHEPVHGHEPASPDPGDDDRRDVPPCPLATGGAGNCVPAGLRAASSSFRSAPPVFTVNRLEPGSFQNRLAATPPFHPPRA